MFAAERPSTLAVAWVFASAIVSAQEPQSPPGRAAAIEQAQAEKATRLHQSDLDAVFERSARNPDGTYRAAARTGQFSDPAAEAHLASVLMQRRDRIARAYLTAVNPLVHPRLSPEGHLAFDDAAAAAGVGDAPTSYRVMWSQVDNHTGVAKPLSETRGAAGVLRVGDLPTAAGAFVQIDVSAEAGGAHGWPNPIHLHFRRTVEGWTLVGLDRGIGRAVSAGSRAAERPPR